MSDSDNLVMHSPDSLMLTSTALDVLRRGVEGKTASGARRMVSLKPEEADALLSLVGDLFLGTCDWGDCERLAVDTRAEHEDAERVPVCIQHSEPYALLEAEHAALMSMVEKAASTLRRIAECETDEELAALGPITEAERTLKAMREIGGFDR